MGTSQYTWSVVRMSIGFVFLFTAFSTAQQLVTTVVTDNTLSFTALCVLYAVFTAMTIVAPKIVETLGPRLCMLLGAVPYVLMVFAYMLPPSWYTFIPAFAGVGVGAAVLWTGQGIYLSRCAIREANLTGDSVDNVTSRMNGLFWTAFQFNGAVGLSVFSVISLTLDGYQQHLTWIFLGYGVLGCIGVLFLSWVPPAAPLGAGEGGADGALEDEEAGAGSPKPAKAGGVSLYDTLRLAGTSRSMQLLLPVILYNGASLGFIGATYPILYKDHKDASSGQDVQVLLPSTYVGFQAATFYLANSLCSYLWGMVVPKIGRRPLFYITLLTHVAFFAGVFIIGSGDSGLTHGSAGSFAAVFGLAAVFAIGDSVLESQVPAIIQSPTFFPEERDREAAVSNQRMWQSLGFTINFVIGALQPTNVLLQAYFLAPLMLLSLVAVWVLDRYVTPIESKGGVAGDGYEAVGGSHDDE